MEILHPCRARPGRPQGDGGRLRAAPDHGGRVRQEVRTYRTETNALLEMADWLTDEHVTHVAMESRVVYCMPISSYWVVTFALVDFQSRSEEKEPPHPRLPLLLSLLTLLWPRASSERLWHECHPCARTGAAARIGQGGRRSHARIAERPCSAPHRSFRCFYAVLSAAASLGLVRRRRTGDSLHLAYWVQRPCPWPRLRLPGRAPGRTRTEARCAEIRDSHGGQSDRLLRPAAAVPGREPGHRTRLNICQEDVGVFRLPPPARAGRPRTGRGAGPLRSIPSCFTATAASTAPAWPPPSALAVAHRRQSVRKPREQARPPLPWAIGRHGRAQMDRFFDLYQEWLRGRPHSPTNFRTFGPRPTTASANAAPENRVVGPAGRAGSSPAAGRPFGLPRPLYQHVRSSRGCRNPASQRRRPPGLDSRQRRTR